MRAAAGRDLRARRRPVQHRLAAAAPRGAVRAARSSRRSGVATRQDRPLDRRRRAARSSPPSIRCRRRSSSTAASRSCSRPTSTRCRRWSIPTTGRMHTSFNQTVAATGRLSSARTRTSRTSRSAPRRGAASARPSSPAPGQRARSPPTTRRSSSACSRTSPSDAGARRRPSATGEDIHARTAADVFDVLRGRHGREAPARQGDQLRHRLRHGPGAARARARRLDRGGAQTYIDEYFARYAGVRGFIDATLAEARERGLRDHAARPAPLPARAATRATPPCGSSPSGPPPTRPSRAPPPTSSSSP